MTPSTTARCEADRQGGHPSIMWVYFTNTDSTGQCATRRLALTLDGERYQITPTSGGAAQVSAAVGEHLVASDDYDVVAERPTDQ